MASNYVRMPASEVRAFLSNRGKRVERVHSFKPEKPLTWPVCKHCGLLLLRNDATRKAAKAVCVTYE